METRLASARQLLLSQEEAIRSRDDDRRQLKARMVTVDLHQRGKDARIQQLTVRMRYFIRGSLEQILATRINIFGNCCALRFM